MKSYSLVCLLSVLSLSIFITFKTVEETNTDFILYSETVCPKGVYDMVSVAGEQEHKEPLSSEGSHDPEYIELQQSEGVYDIARVPDSNETNCNIEAIEPQYMQASQVEGIYDTARVDSSNGTLLNTMYPESQYMEVHQLEGGVNNNVNFTEHKVSSHYCSVILH